MTVGIPLSSMFTVSYSCSTTAPGVQVTICGLGWGCCAGLTGCNCSETSLSFGIATVQTSLAQSASSTSKSEATITSTASLSRTAQITGPSETMLSNQTLSLSFHDKIGIGVGSGLGGLALVIAATTLLCILYKRKQKLVTKPEAVESVIYSSPP